MTPWPAPAFQRRFQRQNFVKNLHTDPLLGAGLNGGFEQEHSGAQRIALWQHVSAVPFFDAGQGWKLSAHHLRTRYDRDHFQPIMQDHPLPRRWRLRDNDRVHLLCDASKFIAALARLDQPEGCFLTFSEKNARHFKSSGVLIISISIS